MLKCFIGERGYKFYYSFQVIGLDKYGMILEVGWMKQFDTIVFNFINSTMKFHYSDLLIVHKGRDIQDNPSSLKGSVAQNLFK